MKAGLKYKDSYQAGKDVVSFPLVRHGIDGAEHSKEISLHEDGMTEIVGEVEVIAARRFSSSWKGSPRLGQVPYRRLTSVFQLKLCEVRLGLRRMNLVSN